MSRSYTFSPPHVPPWHVAGQLYFIYIYIYIYIYIAVFAQLIASNERQRKATRGQMQGNYEWLEL
jgi:hypothetical protein